MKKRLLSLVLCLVMVFSLFPMIDAPARAVVEQDVYESIDGVTWTADPALYQQYAAQSVGNQLYAKIGDEFYPVDYTSTQGELWHADTRPDWTATSAYTAGARGSASDSTLYYEKNLANSSKVVVSKTTKYQSVTNEIDMGASYMNHSYFENHHYSTDFYVYVPHSGTDVDGSYSCWHRVYYREDGYTGDGYYYTFYYYTNSVEGSGASFSNGSAGDVKGSGSSQVRLLCNYHACATWGSRIGVFFEKDGYIKYWHNSNGNAGTDGNLYKTNGTSGEYNYMTVGSTSGTILACQAPASVYSHTYSGTLYTRVNNKVTALKANGQTISNPITEENEVLYSGTLYIKLPAQVTDPDPVTPAEPNPEGILNPGGVDDAGFKLQKKLESNGDGTYDIKMQSYSTANTQQQGIIEKVPTDFVVIVDQSGSMDTEDMATGYNQVNGSKTLEEVAAGKYYVKDGDNYYRVYGTRDYLMQYHASETLWTKNIIEAAGMSLSWFQGEEEASFSQANLYYYKTSDGIYRPVHMTATGKIGTYYVKFYYENAQGTKVDFVRPSKPVYKNVFGSDTSKYGPGSFGYGAVNAAVLTAYPTTTAYTYSTFLGVTTGMYVNYPMYSRHVGYSQLAYRDVDGVEHIVASDAGVSTAEYCNSSEQAITTATGSTRMNYSGLYEATGYERRIDALKGALTEFVKAVSEETDTQGAVDNRIAIVGFSSLDEGGWFSTKYKNTEILTGENLTVSNNNGVQMSDATTNDYKTALITATASDDSKQYDTTTKGLVNTGNGVNDKLDEAINAITYGGGTQPEYGFQMAKSIMDNRTDKEYTFTTGDKTGTKVDRNTIVIFFTDGQPGDYPDSNQYSEANDVIAAALPLKNDGVKVFSIGVFGESDGNPLTYDASNDWAYDQSGKKVRVSRLSETSWKYLGGYMGTYDGAPLRRQWRPNNAEGYTAVANDTIFDYMSVTSSNYPNAANFIAPDWIDPDTDFSGNYVAATDGVRHKDTAASSNQFYRMAANQATLVSAFKQSVTYASVQQLNTGVVNLNTTSIFKDEINTADFDVSHATYSVTWQPIKVDKTAVASTGSAIVNDDSRPLVKPVENREVPADGVIEYSGFDYGANYVSWGKPQGYKLVVTVHGIVPTTYNTTIKSNADDDSKNYYACGIYEYGKNTPMYSVQSPTLYLRMDEPLNSDVEMHKTLDTTSSTDGTYTINLDAYAKGNSKDNSVVLTLDKDAYLLDVIDLDNLQLKDGLDAPEVHVYTVKGTAAQDGTVTLEPDANKVEITESVDISYDAATGAVKVTGFDFSDNYIGYGKPMNVQLGNTTNQGKKLIVTIGGLVPYHAGENQTSNAALENVTATGAGVYDKDGTPAKEVASPVFTIGSDQSKTYLIDFSAPMTLATEATSVAKTEGDNGVFSLIDGKIIYQLDKSVSSRNLVLGGVDKAFGRGKLVGTDMAAADWVSITTIPAGSVYFDDDFTATTTMQPKLDGEGNPVVDDDGNPVYEPVTEFKQPINVGDGSGYNASVSASPASTNTAKGQYTFTFYGTGIDIYCTTANDGGYVQAKCGDEVQTVRNYDKTVTRYNVPSISFTGLTAGEHTVTLNVLGSSNYKLDGIRVYNPVSNETYEGQEAEAKQEQYAAYINMREALVNDNGISQAFTDNMDNETVIGALFVDDSSKLTMEPRQQYDAQTHEPRVDAEGNPIMGPAYASVYEAYQKNSPKHEIYLDAPKTVEGVDIAGQAIIFTLTPAAVAAAESGNLWIGLSAPDAGKNTGTVTLKEGKFISVTSAVDMYYPITSDMIGANRVVTLTNTGDNMISVTNLKITGNKDIYNAANGSKGQTASVNESLASVQSVEDVIPMVFEPMTMRSVKIAANNGMDPDAAVEPEVPETPAPTAEPEVTPEPTPAPTETPAPVVTPAPTQAPSVHDVVKQIVSSFMSNLFRSISRLFGN